jgi:signal peptidase II
MSMAPVSSAHMPDSKPDAKANNQVNIEHTGAVETGPDSQPERPPVPTAGVRSLYWLWLSLAMIVADQITKYMVVSNLVEFDRINVLPIFDLVRFHNTGAAFSLFSDASGWQHWFFSAIAVLVSGGIIWYQWVLPRQGCKMLGLGLALVLGGAIGNLIDRLAYGHVVDFLLVYYDDFYWPAFNVADSAISVGVTFIIIDSLFLERKRNARNA